MLEAASEVLDVVVIGAGVAGLAAAHRALEEGQKVRVLERAARVGGLVSTRTEGGFVIEEGADGMLVRDPLVVALLERLGLTHEVTRGGDAPRTAMVATPSGLMDIPSGLFRFERQLALTMLASPTLSLAAKARLFAEPLARRGHEPDETVAAFVTRRLGREVAERLVDPMLRGVFGAPASKLGVRGAMPALARMEHEHGSLALGLLWSRPPEVPSDALVGGLVTLRRGMASLPERLALELGDRVSLQSAVLAVERAGDHWHVRTHRCVHRARRVVLTCPVFEATRLIAPLSPTSASLLGRIETSRVDVVTFGLDEVPRAARMGTGFVVQPRTGLSINACTFSSGKWYGRAPSGRALVRVTLDRADLSDGEVIALAGAEVERVLGEPVAQRLSRIRRIERALPIYGVGHLDRVRAIRAIASCELPGMAFAGNAYDGVGVPNCVRSGIASVGQQTAAA